MDIRFSLSLPRDEATVPFVRHILGDSLRTLGVEELCIDDIELAVAEACTNVLKHVSGRSEEYEVTVEINDLSCEIRVVDAGRGFVIDELKNGLDVTAEGGRGILLMREAVDDLKFVIEPDRGTVVHLVKALELTHDSLLVPP